MSLSHHKLQSRIIVTITLIASIGGLNSTQVCNSVRTPVLHNCPLTHIGYATDGPELVDISHHNFCILGATVSETWENRLGNPLRLSTELLKPMQCPAKDRIWASGQRCTVKVCHQATAIVWKRQVDRARMAGKATTKPGAYSTATSRIDMQVRRLGRTVNSDANGAHVFV